MGDIVVHVAELEQQTNGITMTLAFLSVFGPAYAINGVALQSGALILGPRGHCIFIVQMPWGVYPSIVVGVRCQRHILPYTDEAHPDWTMQAAANGSRSGRWLATQRRSGVAWSLAQLLTVSACKRRRTR